MCQQQGEVERQKQSKQVNYTQDSSFSKEKGRAVLGWILTHDTLPSRLALYQVSQYQSNAAGRGSSSTQQQTIQDTPNTRTQRTHTLMPQAFTFLLFQCNFKPPQRGQSPYKGLNDWSQQVHYSQVPLYTTCNALPLVERGLQLSTCRLAVEELEQHLTPWRCEDGLLGNSLHLVPIRESLGILYRSTQHPAL